ncbi:MAG: plastocyanin/azurin family copper-binding protein [Solirubrobacteraceae bacterium]
MRKLIVIAIAACVLAALAADALASTTRIKVGDNYYVRARGVPKVTVSKGTTVKWRFGTGIPHSVTVSRGPAKFNSGVKSSGTYTKKVTKRGTYTIYCTIHGGSDQKMKLVVK